LKAKEARDEAIILPPNPAPYITDWLLLAGPASAGGMGEAALTLGQIASDLRAIGVRPHPWEVSTLRRLSQAWISQRQDAEKPDCIEPIFADDQERRRADVSAKVKSMFGNLSKAESPPSRNRERKE
jgi:hypothetical protein